MLAEANKIRAKYANDPLIHADVIKLFADGVLEGNPFAVPPTLPNAAALKPFLQPIFGVDSAGHATVTGYVDTDRKSTRLNSSHLVISYAVFCLKKKKTRNLQCY